MTCMTTLRAFLLFVIFVLVEALTPGGLPAVAGSRVPKHYFEPHPLRFIHIFGHAHSQRLARTARP